VLSRIWRNWKSVLVIVQPETVLRWQKRRFRDYWSRKSKPGRPTITAQHIAFIKRISADHPEYGEDRIALELEIKFGIQHSEATIRKYMVKPAHPHRNSQSWRTFLKNQADAIWTCDFVVQHTVGFTALYIFIVMELGSRKIMHVNATEHPTLAWVQQQIRDATFEEQPKFLVHDNDGIYGQLGKRVTAQVNGKKVSCRSTLDFWLADSRGIRGIPTPYHAPNAQAHIERFNGTLRRELLDRILVWNEGQLRIVLNEYVHGWYNNSRVHQGIHGIPDPDPELAKPKPVNGRLVARPVLGGLHHDYRWAA
jgi:transposase InsO family protein